MPEPVADRSVSEGRFVTTSLPHHKLAFSSKLYAMANDIPNEVRNVSNVLAVCRSRHADPLGSDEWIRH